MRLKLKGVGNPAAEVFDKRRNGRQLAHVSYNGKVWTVPGERLLYAPSVQELGQE